MVDRRESLGLHLISSSLPRSIRSPGALELGRGAIWRERFCILIVRLEGFNPQSGG
jgi:hypothetical protein